MGQYFRAVITNETNTEIINSVSPSMFNLCSKLMENAWIGNPFVSYIESIFLEGGECYKSRLYWAGDYGEYIPLSYTNLYDSGKTFEETILCNLNYARMLPHMDKIDNWYNEERAKLSNLNLLAIQALNEMVNTKRQKVTDKYKLDKLPRPKQKGAVSKTRYIINHTLGEYIDKTTLHTESNGRKIHPLPILTAQSNGEGCGDYYGKDVEFAGRWCGHIISIENKIPSGYNEIKPIFTLE